MSGLTLEQKVAIIRAVTLVGRWGHVLATFEAEMIETLIDRYRQRRDMMTLTANEWRVLQEAVAGMGAASDDGARDAAKVG